MLLCGKNKDFFKSESCTWYGWVLYSLLNGHHRTKMQMSTGQQCSMLHLQPPKYLGTALWTPHGHRLAVSKSAVQHLQHDYDGVHNMSCQFRADAADLGDSSCNCEDAG